MRRQLRRSCANALRRQQVNLIGWACIMQDDSAGALIILLTSG